MSESATLQVPVLVVGAGPVGLSTALALSRLGCRSLVVERHPTTSIHPKARGINVRTMEVFRQWGMESAVQAAAFPPQRLQFFRAPTLTSADFSRSRSDWTSDSLQDISPTSGLLCSQDVLEPVMLDEVRRMGLAQIAFHTYLADFEQDALGVKATLVDDVTGEQKIVHVAYLVAADGAASGVRGALGIAMPGPVLANNISILFRAELAEMVADRQSALYFVANGVFMAVNNRDRWLFGTRIRTEAAERRQEFDATRCTELVRSAVGVSDLQVQLESVLPWTAAARVAEQFRVGRVFLAGDAAHQMTPMGAFGMNTGIQDAHNLAWKLAAVLKGWASPNLLETYEAERKPLAAATVERSRRLWESGGPDKLNGNLESILGFLYQSTAIVTDGSDSVPKVDSLRLARVGARAPHVWLNQAGRRISTLDLFGSDFVLLAGRGGAQWCGAAERVCRQLHVPVQAFTVGDSAPLSNPAGDWCSRYGVSEAGAVLVRPDGYIAWRSPDHVEDSEAEFLRVFRRITAVRSP